MESAPHYMPPSLPNGKTSQQAKLTHGAISTWPGGSPTSSSLATLRLPILPGLEAWLTYSPGAFLAKISAAWEKGRASKGQKVVFGSIIGEQLRRFYLDMRLLKIRDGLIQPGLNPSYTTLPKSGMMVSGVLFRLPNMGPNMSVKERTYLPTPTHRDGATYYILSKQNAAKCLHRYKKKKGPTLPQEAILLSEYEKAMVNPVFYEIIMGLPKNWTRLTELEDSETPCTGPSHTPSSDG